MTEDQEVLQRAEQLIAERNYPDALCTLRGFWLAHPEEPQVMRLMSRLMKSLGKNELSGSLYKLAEHPQAIEHDVQNLFEAGFKLIDEHELELAVMLLERCAAKMPEHAVVAYELGFALMTLHKFDKAVPYFELAFKENRDFDTALNLAVCYTLTRKMDKVSELTDAMSTLVKTDEEKEELAHRKLVVRRLELLGSKKTLTPRDWLFALYGNLILSEPSLNELPEEVKNAGVSGLVADTAGRSGSNTPDYKQVAWTLVVLEKVLSELGFEFDVVEFYSPMSRPLAEAMAHIMNLPAKSFGGEESKDRSLMLMCWSPNIIGPHKSFATNSRFRVLFAYGLSRQQSLPLTPDVVAELCTDCQMPWAQSSEEETDLRNNPGHFDLPDSYQVKATDRILEQISELESRPEIIETVREIVAYYMPKRELLVVGNARTFSQRPEYTAEVLL